MSFHTNKKIKLTYTTPSLISLSCINKGVGGTTLELSKTLISWY